MIDLELGAGKRITNAVATRSCHEHDREDRAYSGTVQFPSLFLWTLVEADGSQHDRRSRLPYRYATVPRSIASQYPPKACPDVRPADSPAAAFIGSIRIHRAAIERDGLASQIRRHNWAGLRRVRNVLLNIGQVLGVSRRYTTFPPSTVISTLVFRICSDGIVMMSWSSTTKSPNFPGVSDPDSFSMKAE